MSIHNMFSFDNISCNTLKNAVLSDKQMKDVKDIGNRENNSKRDFSWIKDFCKNN